MKRIKSDVWLAITIFALASIYLYMDMRLPVARLSDPLGPRAFPALVGVGLIGSALLLLLETRQKRLDERARQYEAGGTTDGRPAEAFDEAVAPVEAEIGKKAHPLILIGMVAWTLVYYLAFEWAGYLIATTVFLFGLLCFFNRKRLTMNVTVALGVSIVFDLLFSQLLGVPMPTGPLPF